MTEIEELQEDLALAKKHLKLVEDALHEAHLRKHGLSAGCLVKSTKTDRVYKFFEVYYVSEYVNKPWIRGYGKKKDGEWSKSHTNLYGGWELVSAPDAAQGDT